MPDAVPRHRLGLLVEGATWAKRGARSSSFTAIARIVAELTSADRELSPAL